MNSLAPRPLPLTVDLLTMPILEHGARARFFGIILKLVSTRTPLADPLDAGVNRIEKLPHLLVPRTLLLTVDPSVVLILKRGDPGEVGVVWRKFCRVARSVSTVESLTAVVKVVVSRNFINILL